MEKLKSYMVKLNKDSIIKLKIYSFSYAIKVKNLLSIVMITNNKYIFFINNVV